MNIVEVSEASSGASSGVFGRASGGATGGASGGVSSLVPEHVIIRVLGRQCGSTVRRPWQHMAIWVCGRIVVSSSGQAAGVAYISRLG